MKQRGEAPAFDAMKAGSFIRGESTLAVVCNSPFDEVAAQLEGSIAVNGLVLVQVHDIGRMLGAKGLAPGLRCRVYEVCDARLAARLIVLDAGLAHLLPWRISMHEQGSASTVTSPMPTVLMSEFSHAANVARLARTLEVGLQRVLRGLR